MKTDSDEGLKRFSDADFPDQNLSGLVIAAGYAVHQAFGYGFLESVYKKALVVELRHKGAAVDQEVRFDLTHRGVNVGVYRADVIVEGRIIIEVKTGLLPDPVAGGQLLNYLAASHLTLGLLLHFGPRLEIKRVIHDTRRASRRAAQK
ncbi:MAG: hypothetical protein JWM87_2450 [Candidatus Eremiobacteraeota bacterium]|nr:hypothetical protein [Candidatus Eremiobacteraeota bacterium]